ncbi:MAG: hypothetical protein O3B13_11835 [Planctomycetota bacterium]|nr:hypothetical protein [Planctomycetota bacterium]MDA1163784.1 hypothetical protein [Planctomycetota bacterium]
MSDSAFELSPDRTQLVRPLMVTEEKNVWASGLRGGVCVDRDRKQSGNEEQKLKSHN